MVKREILFFLGVVLLIGVTSAITTQVHVKTLPWHEVQVTAFDPDASGFSSLDKAILDADTYGDVYWNTSISKKFNLIVYIKNIRGEAVVSGEKFSEEYEPGKDIYIEVAPSGATLVKTPEKVVEEVVEVINETETNLSEEVVPEVKNSLFAGHAILGEGGILSNQIFYYIVGGIILLIIIILVSLRLMRRKKVEGPKEIKVTKLSELKAQQESNAVKNEELLKAEEELKEAQAKIYAIRNKDRIVELQEEIEAKKRELQELGGGRSQQRVSSQRAPQQNPNQFKSAWKPEENKGN